MKICIYGAAREQIDKSFMDAAERLGRSLALRRHTMVFGGGARGMMGAAARGASSEGADIISVAPGDVNVDGELFNGSTFYIYTKTLAERKERFISLSDAFIVLPGGIGTYDEFFDLLSVKRLTEWTSGAGTEFSLGSSDGSSLSEAAAAENGAFEAAVPENTDAEKRAASTPFTPSPLHVSEKPVVLYNINGYFDPLISLIEHTISSEFANQWTRELYTVCNTEQELWRAIERYPEDCCSGEEITDSDFDKWEQKADKGFWESYLESLKK